MHTDDHILTTFLAANRPLQAVAAELRMSVTDLIRWLDRNFELLAAATRAVETRLKFLSLNAEAAAINDLSSVSTSTNDEERKRKSSSQILRHVAKRLCPSRTPQPHEPPARALTLAPPAKLTPPAHAAKKPSLAERFAAKRLAPMTAP